MSGFTKGPWMAHNMTHEEGRPMTAEEIGEYVTNSVKMGELNRFLFVSAKHDDGGDCDVCHIGNGPRGPYNAHLIAAAPDMYEALIEARNELRAVTEELYGEDHNDPMINAALAKAEGKS